MEKKAGLGEIKERLFRALQFGRTRRTVKHLSEFIDRKEPVEFIGQSPRVAELNRIIQAVAQDGYISVLIRGETGTGKELVARSIYRRGWRYGEPFVAVPVVSFPETLLESELFGHEAGAFTDARKRKIGWIEKADGGVLFLDEIGDLPMGLQVKLLRFLEERQFTRVGSTEPIKVDVQVVSATHQDLEKAIAEGRFREDLYYRLKGVQIDLPPLRERKEDIALLADYFLQQFRKQGRTRIESISEDALEVMTHYDWPGNVRELRTAMERAILFATAHGHERIEKKDLPPEIKTNVHHPSSTEPAESEIDEHFDLNYQLARDELKYIEKALRKAGGRKTEAWKILGLNDRFALRRRVHTILRKYPHLAEEFPQISKSFKV
ncbi:MAG: sigma-54-dependent Fis family transcriptional regulator [Calditrichaeota bacterium]|nr:MAG: sigma-54-dependent Fis family transcriptional regulator [Calditrichota bacterium]